MSYISIFITMIVALLYTPVMLRLLGQSEYGLYSLIGSMVGYLSLLDLGLGNAMIRYSAYNRAVGDKDAEARLNGMFLVLYSLIGLLTVIAGAAFYFNLENIFAATLTAAELEKGKLMTILLIINFALSFPLSIFGSIIQAYEKFIFFKLAGIVRSILAPCLILPFLCAGFGSVAMVVINTVLNIGVLLVNLVYCLRVLKIKIRFAGFEYPLLREISGYSFFIFLNVIVDKIYWSTGQVILGVVSGTMLVAVYAIAMQLINMYMMFSNAVRGVLLPRITMMVANNASNDDLSRILIKIGRIQYAVMAYILCGFILFGHAFINLWAGPGYTTAYQLVLFIMIPLTVPMIQNVGVVILQAQNRNAFRSIVYVVIALAAVAASIPMARKFGAAGCAWVTCALLIIFPVTIMNVYYHHTIGLNIRLFWKNIAHMSMPVAAALLAGYGINLFLSQEGILLLVMKMAGFSIFYFLFMWLKGLNRYEKDLFISTLKWLLGRKAQTEAGLHIN